MKGKAISGWKINGKFKRQKTDNETFDAVLNLRIPTVTNLSTVLCLSYKQTLKRVKRLESKGLLRRVKIKRKCYFHING